MALTSSSMFSRETVNLLKYLLAPQPLFHSLVYLVQILFELILKKVDAIFKTGIYQFKQYPEYLREVNKKNNLYGYRNGYLRGFERIYNTKATENIAEKQRKNIKFWDMEIICDDVPDWFQIFEEKEQMFSLHRWGWLLIFAVENPSAETKSWGIKVMLDWTQKMNHQKDHPAWESYSVSERIVNALLFFYVLRDYAYGDEVAICSVEKAINDMAIFLKKHLEFHGELTNNHVLNNARALYMLGRLSSCEALADIGRRIFLNETPRMMTPSGFLREDSSSYHILLLRTYLEALWVAEYTGDDAFYNTIREAATAMLKAAWMLNIYDTIEKKWRVPLVGDVSPDFHREWLNNICRSRRALELYCPIEVEPDEHSGWNRIWKSEKLSKELLSPRKEENKRCLMSGDSGWYRVDHKNIIILWHMNPTGCIPLFSHGHNDIFSFVLYWKGHPVIIDPGRFSYMPDKFSNYGKTGHAHNTFTVDGLEPYPLNRRVYPPQYRRGNPGVEWEENEEGLSLKISHDGFQRINKKISAYREFHVTHNALRITDFVQGIGAHVMKTFFHFDRDVNNIEQDMNNPGVLHLSFNGESITIKCLVEGREPSIKIAEGIREPEPSGWYFPEYGSALPIRTLTIETHKELPYRAEHIIEFPG
ncbi:MAG: heparinase II/III-family protein [Ignavibacteriae bacterium]|nr:heparinase II/III-family protein [Ignavibacteriota bacterium]